MERHLTLTVGELAACGAVLTVASIGTTSLALAQLGQHDGGKSVVLGVLLAGVLATAGLLIGGRPAVEVEGADLALVGGTLLAAAFFFLPGFPYAYGDKDPGLYVAHALSIADHGDVVIPDEVQARGLDPREDPDDQHPFPGVRPAPGTEDAVTSQFFHFDSALMATVADLWGRPGLFNMTPVLGMLAVTCLVLATRRAAGIPVAVVFGALIVTSMLEVWQAKYPSTEIPAQLFLAGALLGGVLAVDRGWAGGTFLAGLLVGTGFLTRPDGFLYLLLAVGMVAVAVALGRADRRAAALGLGVALSLPYALWNAFELRAAYSKVNDVPSFGQLAAACAAILAVGGAVLLVRRRRSPDQAGAHSRPRPDVLTALERWRGPVGIVLTVVAGVVLVVMWFREDMFGVAYEVNSFNGERVRDLDVLNLRWLSLFVTVPGLVLMWLGIAVWALRPSKAALWVLLLPGALLLPLYLWNARVSMRMMWWGRRFVPAVLPAVLLLIAVALGWAIADRRWALRLAGAAAAVALVVTYASQSLPLRDHEEMGGSWQISEAIAREAGVRQGVFLFTTPLDIYDPMLDAPVFVWWAFDQVASKLPAEYDIGDIDAFREAFPDQPVFLVLHDKQIPPWLPPERFALDGVISRNLTVWEEWPWAEPDQEAANQRPDRAETMTKLLTVWRLL